MRYETNRTKVMAKLAKQGWTNVGGAKHDKFEREGSPAVIVPRHKTLSDGVAKSIHKSAGW